MSSLHQQIQELFGKLDANAPSMSEKLGLLGFAVAAQKHKADDFYAVARLGLHEDSLIDKNKKLQTRVDELEQKQHTAPTAMSADTQALQARITSLEAENATLKSRHAVSTSPATPATAQPVAVARSVAESGFATISRLVSGVQVQNLSQRAASSNGVALTNAQLTAQLAEKDRVLGEVIAVVASAKTPSLTDRAIAAQTGKGGAK